MAEHDLFSIVIEPKNKLKWMLINKLSGSRVRKFFKTPEEALRYAEYLSKAYSIEDIKNDTFFVNENIRKYEAVVKLSNKERERRSRTAKNLFRRGPYGRY